MGSSHLFELAKVERKTYDTLNQLFVENESLFRKLSLMVSFAMSIVSIKNKKSAPVRR